MLGLIARTALSTTLGLTLLAVSACKQAEGETCQIDDDCEPPLTCNNVTMQCQRGTGPMDAAQFTPDSGFDAPVFDAAPIDAAPIDAAPLDGPVDAASTD